MAKPVLIDRTVADEYVENHAVRKSQVACALGSQAASGSRKASKLKRSKTRVSGKGQYRVWTAQAMLRVSLLVYIE